MEKVFSAHRDWAPVFLRLTVGIVLFAHGSQKIFGGIIPFAAAVAQLGPPFNWFPALSAYLVASAEFFGGILIVLGLATRWAAICAGSVMLVTIIMAQGRPLTGKNGFELPLILLAACVSLMLTGGGKASLDQIIANRDLE